MERMKTGEQRITEMHRKAGRLRRLQERNALSAAAGLSAALFAVLLWLTGAFSGGSHGNLTGEAFTGASLLSENAGGYVLAAVLAFMAGVCLTVVIFRRRNKMKQENTERNDFPKS